MVIATIEVVPEPKKPVMLFKGYASASVAGPGRVDKVEEGPLQRMKMLMDRDAARLYVAARETEARERAARKQAAEEDDERQRQKARDDLESMQLLALERSQPRDAIKLPKIGFGSSQSQRPSMLVWKQALDKPGETQPRALKLSRYDPDNFDPTDLPDKVHLDLERARRRGRARGDLAQRRIICADRGTADALETGGGPPSKEDTRPQRTEFQLGQVRRRRRAEVATLSQPHMRGKPTEPLMFDATAPIANEESYAPDSAAPMHTPVKACAHGLARPQSSPGLAYRSAPFSAPPMVPPVSVHAAIGLHTPPWVSKWAARPQSAAAQHPIRHYNPPWSCGTGDDGMASEEDGQYGYGEFDSSFYSR